MNKKIKAKLLQAQKLRHFNLVISVAVALIVGVAGYWVIGGKAAAGNATLSLNPASAIVANGSSFTVAIREDSGTNPVNAVQANLTYPATSLELVSIDATNTAFPVEAESSGGSGTIRVARGTSGGTSVTGNQLVATVTFKSLMTSGSATVSFASGSAVVSSVDNTALVLTTNNGTYAPDTTPPSIPASLRSTGATGTTINLAWNASSDNVGVVGYNIYRNNIKVTTVGTTSFSDTGLTQGTSYQYAVTAVDDAGNESAKSSTITASTLDTTAPSVPTGLTLQATSHDQIKLTWNASTDTGGSGLAGYKIYRGSSTTPIGTSATTTFTDTGLNGSTSYTYRVAAYDTAGNESAKSTSATITTPAPPDTTPPTAPANLRVTSNSLTSISLAWDTSTDNVSVSGYRIYRNGTLVASPAGTSFTDSGLAYGTTYQYTVRAIDPSGNLSGATLLNASTLPLKAGDINRDNLVNIFDLSILLNKWNSSDADSDLNKDGTVNIFDLSILLSNWGK